MPNDRDEPDASSRLSPRLFNARQVKEPHKGPHNAVQLLTKLPIHNILSGIIVIKLHDHMSQHMSAVQKGIGNNISGSKHKLLIVTALDIEFLLINLYTAWIDCKKAQCIPNGSVSV